MSNKTNSQTAILASKYVSHHGVSRDEVLSAIGAVPEISVIMNEFCKEGLSVDQIVELSGLITGLLRNCDLSALETFENDCKVISERTAPTPKAETIYSFEEGNSASVGIRSFATYQKAGEIGRERMRIRKILDRAC